MKLQIKTTKYNPKTWFFSIQSEKNGSLFNNIDPKLAKEIAKRIKFYDKVKNELRRNS